MAETGSVFQTVVIASSSPGVPVVSASSGVVQVLTSGTLIIVSASSGLIQTLTTGATVLSSGGVTQVLESTGTAGGVTSTFFVLTTVQPIKTAAGRLFGYSAFTSIALTGGACVGFYNLTTANVSVGTSQTLVVPIQGITSTSTTANTANLSLLPPTWFGPNGLNFGTAISVVPQVSATGSTVITAPVYLSAFYV